MPACKFRQTNIKIIEETVNVTEFFFSTELNHSHRPGRFKSIHNLKVSTCVRSHYASLHKKLPQWFENNQFCISLQSEIE